MTGAPVISEGLDPPLTSPNLVPRALFPKPGKSALGTRLGLVLYVVRARDELEKDKKRTLII